MYLEDGYGYKRASDILGIHDKNTLRLWVKNFNEFGLTGFKNGDT
jgi:transposase-like protein